MEVTVLTCFNPHRFFFFYCTSFFFYLSLVRFWLWCSSRLDLGSFVCFCCARYHCTATGCAFCSSLFPSFTISSNHPLEVAKGLLSSLWASLRFLRSYANKIFHSLILCEFKKDYWGCLFVSNGLNHGSRQ